MPEEKMIGYGKKHETSYFIFESGKPGPVILVEAGIHGDEIAGFLALEEILSDINVNTGKLILFPRMNAPACKVKKRYINVDLNKIFPGVVKKKPYEYALAYEIFNMIGREKIEYVLTLHESRYLRNKTTGKGVAQTVIYGVKPPPTYLAAWINFLNSKVKANETFSSLYYPVTNSSTEVFVDKYSLKGGFCAETWRSFNLQSRIKLHRLVVTTLLDMLGMQYEFKKTPPTLE